MKDLSEDDELTHVEGHLMVTCMKILIRCGILATMLVALKLDAAVLQQMTSGVLAFEAEDFSSLTTGATGSAYSVITTSSGAKNLPAGTEAVGSGLFASRVGASEDGFVTYQLSFTSNGTYYLYTRYSFFEVSGNNEYYQEDSYYSPTAFGQAANTSGTWNNESLSVLDYTPNGNPNEGRYFLWDQGTSTYTVTGASVDNPFTTTFTVRMREGGVVFDRFVFTTTFQTLTAGRSDVLDGIASVPEPARAMLIVLGGMMMVIRRRPRVQERAYP
jgi:hypothetical protein